MNRVRQALAREAGIAAEHICIGVTALGRANYAQHAYYTQAFFALSIGIERSGKLAVLVDHAIDNDGAFPGAKILRAYGHDLSRLLSLLERIADKRLVRGSHKLPRSAAHEGIIQTLSDFAQNITRYYNIELVTGEPTGVSRDDPIASWWRRVTVPILETHYKPRRANDEEKARQVAKVLAGVASVRYHAETGETIDSAYQAATRTGATEFAKPWERMYVLQIARFVAEVMSALGDAARTKRLADVPELSEFFAIFQNDDRTFRARKTWSIYRP